MLDIIEVTNTIESVCTDFTPEIIESHNDLGEAITSLWSAHLNAKSAARATNEELRVIRAKLGERLHELKQVLAKPGRGGQWSSFLKERGIPRATADRLVERHERLINPDANCVSEPISEPTEEEVAAFFKSILPRLRRFLKTPTSLYTFIGMLASHYECSEVTDRGILVLKPVLPTICPASSDGDLFVEPELGSGALMARADEQVI
jgi:hypothetical protein